MDCLFRALLVLSLWLPTVACKKADPLYCQTHEDCLHLPDRPWCDLTGELPGSEGLKNTCVPEPTWDAGLHDASVDAADFTDGGPDAAPADAAVPDAAPSCGEPVTLGAVSTPNVTWSTLYLGDGLLATADSNDGVRLVDVSNPQLPAVTGNYSTIGQTLHLARSGSRLFATAQSEGLEVVDISDPTSPAQLATWHPGGSSGVTHVSISSGRAYISGSGYSLKILDISGPGQPTTLGTLSGGSCRQSVVDDTTVYLSCLSGLKIVDVSTPSSPTLVGSYEPSWEFGQIDVQGSKAWASAEGTVRFLDVSNPQNVQLEETVTLDGASQLVILDAADGEELWKVPATGLHSSHVEIAENRAYLSNFDGPVRIIDICP